MVLRDPLGDIPHHNPLLVLVLRRSEIKNTVHYGTVKLRLKREYPVLRFTRTCGLWYRVNLTLGYVTHLGILTRKGSSFSFGGIYLGPLEVPCVVVRGEYIFDVYVPALVTSDSFSTNRGAVSDTANDSAANGIVPVTVNGSVANKVDSDNGSGSVANKVDSDTGRGSVANKVDSDTDSGSVANKVDSDNGGDSSANEDCADAGGVPSANKVFLGQPAGVLPCSVRVTAGWRAGAMESSVWRGWQPA